MIEGGWNMYKGFSAGLIGFGDKSLAEVAPLAKSLGYEGVDFDLIAEYKNGASYVREQLEKNDLKVGGFALPVDIHGDERKYAEELKALPKYCEFARDTGNLRCIMWVIPFSDTLDYSENFEFHRKRFSECACVLEEYGIRLGLEFIGPKTLREGHKYEFIHTLDGLLELNTAIGRPNMGILMDTFHWDLAGQKPEDFKKIPNKDYIVLAHINDAVAGVPLDEQQDMVRELPGATGVLNIEAYMKGLASVGYDGPVYAEPFSEALKKLPFQQAAEKTKAAIDGVWKFGEM